MFNSSSIEDVPRQQTIIGIRIGTWLILVLTILVCLPGANADEPYPDPADEMWLEVRESDDPALLKGFIETFPDSPYAHTARLRLERLKFGGGEMCDGKPRGSACWLELENQPGCYLWVNYLLVNQANTWSGECVDELAEGTGEIKRVYGGNRDNSSTDTGQLQHGKRQGKWVNRIKTDYPVVQEGHYVDGLKQGHWIHRQPSGDVSEGPYVDGKRHGQWVMRDSKGMELWKGPLVNGNRNGFFVEKHRLAESMGTYVNGKKHGEWVIDYTSGHLTEGTYVNGKKHGEWVIYFKSGRVKKEVYVNDVKQ